MKLPSLRPNELVKILKQLGFVEKRQRGSHLILWHEQSRKRAVIPLHPRDIPPGTLRAIIKEAGLSKEEFITPLK